MKYCIVYVHLDGSSVCGLVLKYKEQEEMLEVKLTVVESADTERKQALAWLAAMQKVSNFINIQLEPV